ncbi:hypothetical protein [Streptomyces sp. NK08204]|uniref:hypothetical protein n=1 Tax=Streptomyces sp. NK08204 TaxID=2873260 RepID=UPI001CED4AA5|nr:hypothetical protein [Streptomyces sp. NK08204]
MTQSGQGEEPSAQRAHEGIVLPSDGGEPVLPGMNGGAPASPAPAGGQAWDGSWGPGGQTPGPGRNQPAPQGHHWGADQQPPSATGPGPLPPEGAPAPSYGGQAYGAPSYGAGGPGQAYASHGHDPAYGFGQQPAYGTPDPYQHHQQQYDASPPAAAPLPPALPDGYPAQNAPQPSAADGATQYIPPVPAAPADGATQYIPPVPAAPADGATQYIPPVPATPGALPPESGADETRYLGLTPKQPAPASDADATQLIPPYSGPAQGGPAQGADRQPPAEFDNLFRSGPPADGPAGATQQLPRIQRPDAYPGPVQPPHTPPQSSHSSRYDDEDHDRRGGGRSRVPLIAAVGIGLAVLGVGAGALLSGGGGGDKGDGAGNPAASVPAQDSASPSADPARQQAVALDELLSDSGSSRASVIKAVSDVRQCDNLDDAASSLREAAKQRNQLVTRLGKLSVDKLPSSAELTTALTKAWQASASADSHYAQWADQTGGHRGCRHGHARITSQTQAGNRQSGVASEQKVKAAALWNTIAKKYGLTQRQPTQL